MKESSLDFVKRMGWKYRLSTDGKEIETECPFENCPNAGQTQFYISVTKGEWFCHRCSKRGRNIRTLQLQLGLLKPLDNITSTNIAVTEAELKGWQDALFSNSEALAYLYDERGFTAETIRQAGLGFRSIDNRDALVLPFRDATQQCVGLKYQFYNSFGEPKCRWEVNSAHPLFVPGKLDLTQPVILTEGELDAISLWQYGYFNVASIPDGANSNGECLSTLESVPQLFLAYDHDPAGNQGAIKAAFSLGASKCFRVRLPFKDANECLQLGVAKSEIDKAIKLAEPMFKAPIFSIENYQDKANELLSNPVLNKGYSTGWQGVDEHLGGVRMGEVTTLTGITTSGKSTFSVALVANMVRQGIKSLVISPEMREEDILLEVASNEMGNRIQTPAQLEQYQKVYKDRLYISPVFNEWNRTSKTESILNRTFDIVEFAIRYKGVRFVLLDHLRLFLDVTKSEDERLAIDNFFKQCVRMAAKYQVHILLIVQPRKMDDTREVEIYDLKGSSNIEQDSHNIIILHRDDKKGQGLVKVKFGKVRSIAGKIGSTVLLFNKESKANYEDFRP